MRLFLAVQVFLIGFYRERPQVRLSHPMDGVTAFHLLLLYLVFWRTSSLMTIFLTDGNLDFHVLILSLVHLVKVFVSDRLSYG